MPSILKSLKLSILVVDLSIEPQATVRIEMPAVLWIMATALKCDLPLSSVQVCDDFDL